MKVLNMNKPFRPKNEQAGVVLVVCLIMLLLLTLMGVSGMGTTALEEKMASNMRDRNIAFQAAESTLRHAEQFVEDGNANSNATTIGNAQGPFPIPVASNIAGLSAQPTYTITLLAVDYFAASGAKHATYQLTATGLGASSTTIVRLRTIYIAQIENSVSII